ncbi:hypothetical protein MUK42_11134, partial [Musa troglodytarum]
MMTEACISVPFSVIRGLSSQIVLLLGMIRALRRFFMTTVNSSFSVMSTSSPSTLFHSNSLTRLATKYSRWSMASPSPGHMRLPAPKGIIVISLLPVMSTAAPPPPLRNLSGLNSIGSSHTFPSQFISATQKLTAVPLGIRYPHRSTSSVTAWLRTKWPGGCRRSPSSITAFRYGILCRSSSLISSSSLPSVAPSISSRSFSCMSWCFTRFAMIHCNAVDVVSVPAFRNSEQRATVSSSESFLPPSSGSSISNRLQSIAEDVPGDAWNKGQHAEFSAVEEEAPLRLLDILDGLLDEQAEHSELEALHGVDHAVVSIGLGSEVLDENTEDPRTGASVELDAGVMEDLRGEVAAEEAPDGAIGGGGDVVLAHAEEADGRQRGGSVGEGSAVLDERLVGDGAVRDEDGGAGADAKRDDGTVPSVELPQDVLDVSEGPAEPQEVAEDRHRRRAGREPPNLDFTVEEEEQQRGQGDGEEDEPEINIKPWDEEFQNIKLGSQTMKWRKRARTAYWKGNPDVQSPVREAFYKIYAEGYAWSVSLKYIVACGSLALIIEPRYEDFFSRGLVPKENYWPISPTDLCPSIKFAAEAIGKKGQAFMQELNLDQVYDYMYHLIEYSKLQRISSQLLHRRLKRSAWSPFFALQTSSKESCSRDHMLRLLRPLCHALFFHPASLRDCESSRQLDMY